MRKVLPNNKLRSGFTLIELLVVIAIIAILATIGAVIFSGVQGRARDGRRQADVQAIAKALEANKVATTTVYPSLNSAWFAGGAIPVDPSATGSFCIGWNNSTTGQAVARPAAWGAAGACPTVAAWAGGAGAPTEVDAITTTAAVPCAGAGPCTAGAPSTATNFQVCAQSEVTATVFFCRPNSQ